MAAMGVVVPTANTCERDAIIVDNLYSAKNTVAAINKQKQHTGLYTYIIIA